MDILNKLLKIMDHERGKIICILVAFLIVGCVVGCPATTTSKITGETVDRQGLAYEFDKAQADIAQRAEALETEAKLLVTANAISNEELNKTDAFRTGAINTLAGVATTVASGGTLGAPAIIASLVGLAGIGGTVGGLYDSNRKNAVIENLKT